MIFCSMSEYWVYRFHLYQLYHPYLRKIVHMHTNIILLVQLVLLEPEQRGTLMLAATYKKFDFFLQLFL